MDCARDGAKSEEDKQRSDAISELSRRADQSGAAQNLHSSLPFPLAPVAAAAATHEDPTSFSFVVNERQTTCTIWGHPAHPGTSALCRKKRKMYSAADRSQMELFFGFPRTINVCRSSALMLSNSNHEQKLLAVPFSLSVV